MHDSYFCISYRGADKLYARLEIKPFQFPESKDRHLQSLHCRTAFYDEMDYVMIFCVDEAERKIYIFGIFRQQEKYSDKL